MKMLSLALGMWLLEALPCAGLVLADSQIRFHTTVSTIPVIEGVGLWLFGGWLLWLVYKETK
jgi:hypothetical protein